VKIDKQKKVVFYDYDHNYVNFKVRLKYDNIAQGDFFRFLIGNYINNDSRMLKMIEDYKIKYSTMGKKKVKRASREFAVAEDMLKKMGITDSDKEFIFDLIEEKTGEDGD